MKNLLRAASLSGAILMALFSISARAQVMTYETISQWTVGNLWGINNNSASTETFDNVLKVQSMTFRFVGSNTSAVTLSAYFTEWDPATRTTVGAPLWTPVGGTFTVPAASAFTQTDQDANSTTYSYYDQQLIPNITTDGAKTYAMILLAADGSASRASTNLSLLQVAQSDVDDPATDPFIYGISQSKRLTASNQSANGNVLLYSQLASTYPSAAGFAGDYGFSQIAVIPVPEAQTAAAAFGALFVAALVARRVYQRRQQALVPVPVA